MNNNTSTSHSTSQSIIEIHDTLERAHYNIHLNYRQIITTSVVFKIIQLCLWLIYFGIYHKIVTTIELLFACFHISLNISDLCMVFGHTNNKSYIPKIVRMIQNVIAAENNNHIMLRNKNNENPDSFNVYIGPDNNDHSVNTQSDTPRSNTSNSSRDKDYAIIDY